MERIDFYNKISPCGEMKYIDTLQMIQLLTFDDVQIQLVLIERLKKQGILKREDWLILFSTVKLSENAPNNFKLFLESTLDGKCKVSRDEMKLFLEYAIFDYGNPTYLLTQNNDFIITE